MSNNSIELEFFEIFPWAENFETGIEIIDEQHKVLVNILNKLAANLANLSNEILLNDIFDELTAYTDYHFKTEETLWEIYFKNDRNLEQHKKTHKKFIEELINLKNSKDYKNFDESIFQVVNFLAKWLAYHILDTDKRMSMVVKYVENGFTIEESKIKADAEMEGMMEVLVNTVLTMYENLSVRTLDLMREKALRLKAEKSLLLNEERWKFILDGGLENLWDFKIDNSELFCESPNFCLETLFNKEIVKNREFMKIHSLDIERIKEDFKNHLENKTPYFKSKFRLIDENNCWSWLLSRGKIVSNDGKQSRLVGTNSDITEKEMASLIYKHSSQAMFLTDNNNHIININPAFTEITGYSLEDVIGKDPKILSSKKHTKLFYKKLWDELEEHGYYKHEIENKRKNGEVFTSILTVNVIKGEKGEIDYYVALFADINDKKEAEKKIIQQASFDPLTNLYNRRIFELQIEQEIVKSNRREKPFALFFIDLDHFKDVNDTLGHEVGDKVLVEASKRIYNCIRESDILSRFGGDEFTLMVTDLENLDSLESIATKIIEEIKKPFYFANENIFISSSIGITIYPNDAKSKTELLKNADQAMYEAKKQGRSRFQYFLESMQVEAIKNRQMITDLYSALKNNEFEIYYQPIVDFQTEKVVKAEALIRWNRPGEGLVYPNEFIHLAEKSSLILKISDWVSNEILTRSKIWKEKFDSKCQISFNNSPIEFKIDMNVDKWFNKIEEYGLNLNAIGIEITENILMDCNQKVKNKLSKLAECGVEISIDDFGTGYSSLTYLKKFNIDYIKIDKSFVENLDKCSKDRVLCEAMVVMAHKLDIKVIAEGIENETQRDILNEIGCDYAQGFLYSKPLKADEFEEKYFH